MELNGAQYEQLEKALSEAYPNEASLSRMVRITFDKRLNELAEGGNHIERIDKLIEWAEAEGREADLIRGAHRRNPTNERLKRFCQDHSQLLLIEACLDNMSKIEDETVQSLVRLSLSTLPIDKIETAVFSVLPSGASDDLDDKDLGDFRNKDLVPPVRLYGFLKLALAKYPWAVSKQQPTLLLFARELGLVLAADLPAKVELSQWIHQVESELGPSLPLVSSTAPSRRPEGTLEASLMITVRLYSKQQKDKALQYRVSGCLYFDQITGRTPPSLEPKPPVELSLPEAQDQLGVVCPWKQLPERTDQFLAVAVHQLTHELKQELGYRNHKLLTIELFLPLEYMGEAIDQWTRTTRQAETLGKEYGIIVRFCDRLDDDERLNAISLVWEELKKLLKAPNGGGILQERFELTEDLNQYSSWRYLEVKLKEKLGLKWCCGLPETTEDQKKLFEAILFGDIPIAVWTRSADIVRSYQDPGGGQALNLSQVLTPFISAKCLHHLGTLAEMLIRDRRQAWSEASEEKKGRCLGDHIAFLLDNPDRLPLPPLLAS